MTIESDHRHQWITWRAHAWWAALVMVPFLVPHAVLMFGERQEQVGSTLVLYGPIMAALWIGGHVVLHHLRRDRPHVVTA